MQLYPFLKDNIQALEKFAPKVYQWLSSQIMDPKALEENLMMNKWGMLDWRMDDGGGLMEPIPPNSMYNDWTADDKPHTSATLIIGSNLGYGVNKVLMATPDSHKVVVLEPNPNMLLACLGQSDYRPFMEIKKLHFCIPDEDYLDTVIKHLDLQFVYGRIYVRPDIASQQLGSSYARWLKTVRKAMENYSVELTTLRFKQDVMVGNELKNFNRSLRDGTLTALRGAGEGLGAVILGAGPSLNEYAPLLAKNPGHVLYTTALQTLPAVHAAGIKPHLCMAIDYDHSMLALFDRLDREWAKDIPLVYSTKINPDVLRKYPGPTLPMWTLGGMATFALRKHDLIIDAGGNVSVTLNRFLNYIGVHHTLLVGQDFAWKGDVSHAGGHHSSLCKRVFDPRRHVRRTNLDGEEIITTLQYLTSMREMEQDIRDHGHLIYNLYGGGMHIKGSRPVDMDKAVKKGLLSSEPGAMERFLRAMDKARTPRPRPMFEARSHEWTASLRNVEKRLTKLMKKPDRHQEEIHTIMEQAVEFLKQDVLYLPYLFNEILNMSGLARTRIKYTRPDLSEFRKISKQVLDKVREIDRTMCAGPHMAAA